jgi:tetratricopeptide (TPR) repeat protein
MTAVGLAPAEAKVAGRRLSWTVIGAIATSVLALIVYLIGMGETTPFWDAGEFIATSWILGIPHPPGTPLYVLLGRVASLFPFGTVAERVNGLSAVAGALAVFFTVLATSRLLRPLRTEDPRGELLAALGGVVAGLFLAFSNTFWINAIEAEVYALSSLVMAAALWATLVWRDAAEAGEPAGDGRSLLLVFYLLSLSIAIHLGTYLILPGLILLVALERRHTILTARDLLVWCVIFPVVALVAWKVTGGGRIAWLALAALVGGFLAFTERRGFVRMLLLLFVLGVSVHLFLLIRSQLDPQINEAAPKTWNALWEVLTRKQYPATNIFERRAPFWFQVDRMYLHYLREQFLLAPDGGVLARILPLALGVLGAISLFMRRPRDGGMMVAHFLVMSLLLIIYLNLSGTLNPETKRWEMGEVRERDYFFVPSFTIFAMWIGIGAATLLAELNRSSAKRVLPLAAAALVGIAVLPLAAGFEAHDRRGNFVARDYGYNILNFVEQGAIIFTNGDNDTFPLWYLQEVEGIRRDVRIVCLSLLNTGWYIKQLRDYPPKVPISWTDGEIDSLKVAMHPREGYVTVLADGSYEPGTIKDVGVRHIIKENNFRRPIYFAVTVPDRVGYDRQLSFEGMVFRVFRDPVEQPIDFERAYANAFHNYLYRGILRPDDTRERNVRIDETGEYLIHNYVIHFAELAFELERQGRPEEALRLLTRCEAIAPDRGDFNLLRGAMLDDVGRSSEAESIFRSALAVDPNLLDAHYRLGVALYRQDRLDEARAELETAARLAEGQFFEPVLWLARIDWDAGDPAAARRRIGQWLIAHPGDERASKVMEQLSRSDDSGLPQ